jgi:hypothetical protein
MPVGTLAGLLVPTPTVATLPAPPTEPGLTVPDTGTALLAKEVPGSGMLPMPLLVPAGTPELPRTGLTGATCPGPLPVPGPPNPGPLAAALPELLSGVLQAVLAKRAKVQLRAHFVTMR